MNPQQGKICGTAVVKRKDGTTVQFKFSGHVEKEKSDGGDALKRSS